MSPGLQRRDVLRAAGVIGIGTAAAGALTGTATAAPHGRKSGRGHLGIRKDSFGTTPDGEQVDRYTFWNGRGVNIAMITWGATIQTMYTPDRHGRSANINLGFATLEEYIADSPYFGSTIGRYGNRIANAQFTLDGTTYTLPANDGPNTLHGGTTGFDKVVWDAEVVEHRNRVGVSFTYVSPNEDMGFPGTLTTNATYTLDKHGRLRDRIPRHDRQGDRSEPHQPRVLQPGR